MSTKKDPSGGARSTGKAPDKQQASAADFDKLAKEAEQDSPRGKKPGSSSGHNTKVNNNGRGGGK